MEDDNCILFAAAPETALSTRLDIPDLTPSPEAIVVGLKSIKFNH
jgi:hypothetical protein